MTNREKKSEEPTSVVRTAQQLDQVTQVDVNALFPVLWQASSVRVPPVLGSRAAILRIQHLKGNRVVGQMLAALQSAEAQELREPSDEAIRSAAAEGVRTPAVTLPFLDRIQASFGRYSIGHVKAHVGPKAAKASRAMNALAFASGDHVVFGGTPDLRTAAHETAHIVQQQAGVQLSGGIGREGDVYERNADAVAGAVVAGRSAEGLLEPLVRPPIACKKITTREGYFQKRGGAAQQGLVQCRMKYVGEGSQYLDFFVKEMSRRAPLFRLAWNDEEIICSIELEQKSNEKELNVLGKAKGWIITADGKTYSLDNADPEKSIAKAREKGDYLNMSQLMIRVVVYKNPLFKTEGKEEVKVWEQNQEQMMVTFAHEWELHVAPMIELYESIRKQQEIIFLTKKGKASPELEKNEIVPLLDLMGEGESAEHGDLTNLAYFFDLLHEAKKFFSKMEGGKGKKELESVTLQERGEMRNLGISEEKRKELLDYIGIMTGQVSGRK